MPDDALRVLVVDDDPALLTVLEAGLAIMPNVHVTALVKAADALAALQRERWDLLIADFSLGDPTINGLTLLGAAQQREPRPMTIIITAYASLQITLQSIQLGAYDFLTKPFQIEELQLVVRNAAALRRSEHENRLLRDQLGIMIESMARLERAHLDLTDKLRGLSIGPIELSLSDTGPPISPGLDGPAVQELRRRRMRDQVNSYQRMSESLRDQLEREREKIASLVEVGLIPAGTYERALREGRLGEPERIGMPVRDTQG